MFPTRVNAPFLNKACSAATIPAMTEHPSVARLLQCARMSTADKAPSRRVQTDADLQRLMGISPQNYTVWKRRGVSKQGALKAEHLFGCAANWVRDGTGPRWTELQHPHEGVRTAPLAQEMSHPPFRVPPVHIAWEDILKRPLPAEFQTTAADSALAPEVPRGTTVMMITGTEPEPGDFVLASDRDGNTYLREYRMLKAGHWVAHATNSAYLPLDSVAHGLTVLAIFEGARIRRSRR